MRRKCSVCKRDKHRVILCSSCYGTALDESMAEVKMWKDLLAAIVAHGCQDDCAHAHGHDCWCGIADARKALERDEESEQV